MEMITVVLLVSLFIGVGVGFGGCYLFIDTSQQDWIDYGKRLGRAEVYAEWACEREGTGDRSNAESTKWRNERDRLYDKIAEARKQ